MTLFSCVVRLANRLSNEERARLLPHLFALGVVAAAAVAMYSLGATGGGVPFALYSVAVVASAIRGGWPPAVVATLTSLLVARVVDHVRLAPSVWFLVEALVLSVLTIRLKESLQLQRRRTVASDALIGELKEVEQQGAALDAAFFRLQEACRDTVIVLLDDEGRIFDWGMGAERLYTRSGLRGLSFATLFSEPPPGEELSRILRDARENPVSRRARHRRGDDTEFEADIEIARLLKGRFSGFSMVVHDCSRHQAWEAFAQSAADAQVALRREAYVAHQQLATLQNMTDPALDTVGGIDGLTMLLDRLGPAVGADGVALVDLGAAGARVLFASDGLRGRIRDERASGVEGSHRHQPGHTLLIHNDAERVAEMSLVRWPEGVVSLIAVPVARRGNTLAVLEVVNTRGRRSTEWDLALIQVVAARSAGLSRDESDSVLPGQYAVDHFA